jgi:hypothetical protein
MTSAGNTSSWVKKRFESRSSATRPPGLDMRTRRRGSQRYAPLRPSAAPLQEQSQELRNDESCSSSSIFVSPLIFNVEPLLQHVRVVRFEHTYKRAPGD